MDAQQIEEALVYTCSAGCRSAGRVAVCRSAIGLLHARVSQTQVQCIRQTQSLQSAHLTMPVDMKPVSPVHRCLHVSLEQPCSNLLRAWTASRPIPLTGQLPTPAYLNRSMIISDRKELAETHAAPGEHVIVLCCRLGQCQGFSLPL